MLGSGWHLEARHVGPLQGNLISCGPCCLRWLRTLQHQGGTFWVWSLSTLRNNRLAGCAHQGGRHQQETERGKTLALLKESILSLVLFFRTQGQSHVAVMGPVMSTAEVTLPAPPEAFRFPSTSPIWQRKFPFLTANLNLKPFLLDREMREFSSYLAVLRGSMLRSDS